MSLEVAKVRASKLGNLFLLWERPVDNGTTLYLVVLDRRSPTVSLLAVAPKESGADSKVSRTDKELGTWLATKFRHGLVARVSQLRIAVDDRSELTVFTL